MGLNMSVFDHEPSLEFLDWSYLKNELGNNEYFNSKKNALELPNAPRVASIFAGCGGTDLGLKWAGYKTVYSNELDARASETYNANFDHAIDNRSVTDVNPDSIPEHDLLVGGFPCQPFSYAGKREGFSDPRGMLFFSLAKILENKRPRHFLFENVKGLLNHDQGNTFRNVSRALKDVGYKFSYTILNAADYGIPQRRERLIIVGVRDDIDGYFEFPDFKLPRISIKEAIGDLLGNDEVANNEPMRHSKRILERYKYIPQGGTMADVPEEHQQRKRGEPEKISGKQSTQSYHRLIEDMPSPTVTAMFQAHFIHYREDRNLTAREAARLQSFPDDFVFCGKRTVMSWEKELSQYQQIGNAVPPKLAYVIGRGLYEQFFR